MELKCLDHAAGDLGRISDPMAFAELLEEPELFSLAEDGLRAAVADRKLLEIILDT
jgi:hypothetical protein